MMIKLEEEKPKSQKVKRYWKTLAIIFIILFVLETLFMMTIFSIGISQSYAEDSCALDICHLGEGDTQEGIYDSYFYDVYEEKCYCYKDNEIVLEEFLK